MYTSENVLGVEYTELQTTCKFFEISSRMYYLSLLDCIVFKCCPKQLYTCHSANSFCLHFFLLRTQHGPKLINGRYNSWHVIILINLIQYHLHNCPCLGRHSGGWVSARLTGCLLLEGCGVERKVLMFQFCGCTFNWLWALRASAILIHSSIRFATWCVAVLHHYGWLLLIGRNCGVLTALTCNGCCWT